MAIKINLAIMVLTLIISHTSNYNQESDEAKNIQLAASKAIMALTALMTITPIMAITTIIVIPAITANTST